MRVKINIFTTYSQTSKTQICITMNRLFGYPFVPGKRVKGRTVGPLGLVVFLTAPVVSLKIKLKNLLYIWQSWLNLYNMLTSLSCCSTVIFKLPFAVYQKKLDKSCQNGSPITLEYFMCQDILKQCQRLHYARAVCILIIETSSEISKTEVVYFYI
jgi:hypothetical protein